MAPTLPSSIYTQRTDSIKWPTALTSAKKGKSIHINLLSRVSHKDQIVYVAAAMSVIVEGSILVFRVFASFRISAFRIKCLGFRSFVSLVSVKYQTYTPQSPSFDLS